MEFFCYSVLLRSIRLIQLRPPLLFFFFFFFLFFRRKYNFDFFSRNFLLSSGLELSIEYLLILRSIFSFIMLSSMFFLCLRLLVCLISLSPPYLSLPTSLSSSIILLEKNLMMERGINLEPSGQHGTKLFLGQAARWSLHFISRETSATRILFVDTEVKVEMAHLKMRWISE